MKKIGLWFFGYVKLYVTGAFTERFLSLINNKNIEIWNVEPVEDGYTFYIRRKDVYSLKAFRKKTATRIKVMEKHGLPFLLFRYRKRKMLVLSVILCGILVYLGSLFIWDINVSGTYCYTDEQIKTRIEQEYVILGQKKSQIDCEELEENLRADFPEISWISCEIVGTQLNVVIKETLEGTETIYDESVPQDIIAAKEGVIVEIITRSGTPVVKRGYSVNKGDILISGVVNIYDDYDEILESDYVVADGDVIAETSYEFSYAFDMEYNEKQYTGKHQKEIIIQVMNRSLKLSLPHKEYMNYDDVEETHQLCIGHTYYLPVSLTVHERREYEPQHCQYSEEEAKERMNQKIQSYLDDLSEKEVEIMENHVTIDISNGVCSANGTIVVWERIGYGHPISGSESSEE